MSDVAWCAGVGTVFERSKLFKMMRNDGKINYKRLKLWKPEYEEHPGDGCVPPFRR